MRVVAGRARGMRLVCPSGDEVRPVPDMAREAIFNILRHDLEDAVALDLFAGAGAMGIEALSRGASWCVFVERSARVRRSLDQNLAHTRLAEFCDVLQRDAFKCVPFLKKLGRGYDIVFVCPPFPLLRSPGQAASLTRLLGELTETGLLKPGAQVILQHEKRSLACGAPPGLKAVQRRAYGRNLFTFYAAGEVAHEEDDTRQS